MTLPALVAMAVLAAHNEDTPWLPVQASAAALGQIDTQGGTTLGASLYVGAAVGHPGSPAHLAPLEGLVWGIGLHGFIGSTDLPDCSLERRCARRRYVGAAARVGWAFAQQVQANHRVWPDTYLYAQASPFVGWESLPSAPLTPNSNLALAGVRFDFGITSMGWTKAVLGLLAKLGSGTSNGKDVAYAALLLVPLSLLNHLEMNVEWSSAAFSPSHFRFGFTLGTSF